MRCTDYAILDIRQLMFTGKIIFLVIRLLLPIVIGPQNLSAQEVTATTVTLSWTAPGDDGLDGTASQYDIRYSKTPLTDANWHLADPLDNLPSPREAGNHETFVVDGLEPATNYYFGIRSADEVPNWSGLSNIIIRRTLDEPLSAPQTVFPPDEGIAKSSQPNLIINNVAGLKGDDISYFFEVSLYADFSTLSAYSGAVSEGAEVTTWHINTALQEGVGYFWRARTYMNSAYGAWSNANSFTVETSVANNSPSMPIINQPVGGEMVKTDEIEFIWQNSGDSDGDELFYEIVLFDSAGIQLLEENLGISEDIGPSSSFTSRYQFSIGNWYRWRIRAFDGIDYSNWTNYAYFLYTEDNPPAAITSLIAGNTTLATAQLGWIATGDDSLIGTAAGYDIRYALFPITEANWSGAYQVVDEPIPQESGSLESYTMIGLQPNMTYYFGIKVYDDAGNWSAVSNIASAFTNNDSPPEAISDLTVETGDTLGELLLSWTVPADAASYQIAYSRDTITTSNYLLATFWDDPPEPLLAGEVQSFVLSSLVPAAEYWVAMLVLDSADNVSEISNIVRNVAGWDFGSGTGDEGDALPNEFCLMQNYPNPFNPTTQFKFNLVSTVHVTIQVFNVLGQLITTLLDEVKPAGIHTVSWDGSDDNGQAVKSGVYTYRIIAGNEMAARQMILLK
jgi:hypothetical protein